MPPDGAVVVAVSDAPPDEAALAAAFDDDGGSGELSSDAIPDDMRIGGDVGAPRSPPTVDGAPRIGVVFVDGAARAAAPTPTAAPAGGVCDGGTFADAPPVDVGVVGVAGAAALSFADVDALGLEGVVAIASVPIFFSHKSIALILRGT